MCAERKFWRAAGAFVSDQTRQGEDRLQSDVRGQAARALCLKRALVSS